MPRPLPRRHRLLSALLALLVLATSVGLTAERHRCRISGRSTVALVLPGSLGHDDASEAPAKPGAPCGSRKAAKRRADGCCDISHVLHKLDAKQHAGAPVKFLPEPPQQLPPAVLPAPAWAGRGVAAPLAAGVAVGTATNSSPPGTPRAGRVLLTLISTLVV